MNEALAYVVAQRMERTAAALRKNNMEAYCVKTAGEVVPLVKTLLAEGATVGAGGSMTLEECGVMDLLRSGAYHFLDRGAPGLTPEDIGKIYRQIFSADCYFASANAVTEAGEILNVDGNANRVAAITFGPASVILVVGCNKIVKDLAAADARVKAVAAPANAKRLSCKTPCAVTGQCENCQSPGRICCTYVLHRYQRVPGRIKVILVGQELVLFSTRPFLFSISNLPCRLRHTKTYRNGRWVPCRSFTLPSSACGQGRAGGLRSPHIGLRAPFKWLVGLNIWRIKSHRAGCLPVYWPPLRSMSYNSSRRRANMSLTS